MPVDDERRSAFEQLFAAYYWAVWEFVLRRTRQPAGEDIVAETFLVAWRGFDDLDGDPLPWLLGIARRVVANHLRAERRQGALADRLQTMLGADASGWEPPLGMSSELAQALASLSARERDALLLVAWEGLDPAGAAKVVGCTATALRVRLHRARRRVAAALAADGLKPNVATATQEVPCSSRTA